MKNLTLHRLLACDVVELKKCEWFCVDPNPENFDTYFYEDGIVYKVCVKSNKVTEQYSLQHLYPDVIPNIVGMSYVSVSNNVFLVLINGDIISVENGQFELVGEVAGGLLAAEWSPDEELVVLVTGEYKVMVMTTEFDPIIEVPVHQEGFGENQFVNVGWGKKETQFHGSAGKAAARAPSHTSNTSPTVAFPWDDQMPRVRWRGDSALFAISSLHPYKGSRELRVFSRGGSLQSTGEATPGLEHALDWRPSGSVIASSQRLPNKHIVAFFEKNGLRHGEFSLPFQPDEVKDDVKSLKKAELSLKAKNVSSIEVDTLLKIIRARIAASMKKLLYSVEVDYNNRKIIATCDCARGLYRCHHIAAALLWFHYNVSSTDNKCTWNERNAGAGKRKATHPVEDTFSPKRPEYRATQYQLKEEEILKFSASLGCVGYRWLLSPEPTNSSSDKTPEVQVIQKFCKLELKEFFNVQKNTSRTIKEVFNILIGQVKLSQSEIYEISEATKDQSLSYLWFKLRFLRPTGSIFSSILIAVSKGKICKSLWDSMTTIKNLKGIKAIEWGKTSEKSAVEAFTTLTGKVVTPTGTWFSDDGLAAATPDGLILEDDACLEAKAPYALRLQMLKEALSKPNNKYFVNYKNDSWEIKYNHPYYHQIQLQIYCTKTTKCYFVIWTTVDFKVFTINKDEDWQVKNIPHIRAFYENLLIKKCLESTF